MLLNKLIDKLCEFLLNLNL